MRFTAGLVIGIVIGTIGGVASLLLAPWWMVAGLLEIVGRVG